MVLIDRLADRAAELSAGAVALALGDASGLMQGLATVAGVALLGKRLRDGAASRTCRDGAARGLAALHGARTFDAEALDRAGAILSELPATARITPADIVAHVRAVDPARALAADLAARLTGPDDPEVRQILTLVLAGGVAACLEDAGFRAALTPALVMQTAREVGLVLEGIDRLDRRLDALPEQLAALLAERGLTGGGRADLDRLAAVFGVDARDMSTADLVESLTRKAEDHAALQHIFAALDDRLADVARFKGEAQAALAHLDLRHADEVLERIDVIETEIVGNSRLARVEAALLAGDVQAALGLFRSICALLRGFGRMNMADTALKASRHMFAFAERHGSIAAYRAAFDLAQDAFPMLDDLDSPDARPLRVRAAVCSAVAMCGMLTRQTTDQIPRLVQETEAMLEITRHQDTEPGTDDWRYLLNIHASFLRSVSEWQEAGEVTGDPLARADALLTEVLATLDRDADLRAWAESYVALQTVRLRQGGRAAYRDDCIAMMEALTAGIEDHILARADLLDPHIVDHADQIIGHAQLAIAQNAEGPARDAILQGIADRFARSAERARVAGETGRQMLEEANRAIVAMLRATGARGAAVARLRAEALARIEATEALADPSGDSRLMASMADLRARLDAACPAPDV